MEAESATFSSCDDLDQDPFNRYLNSPAPSIPGQESNRKNLATTLNRDPVATITTEKRTTSKSHESHSSSDQKMSLKPRHHGLIQPKTRARKKSTRGRAKNTASQVSYATRPRSILKLHNCKV